MCGITGIMAFDENGKMNLSKVKDSCDKISSRGPDGEGFYSHANVSMGHRRLSIIDISENASQPMTDPTGRFTIIFNGEIFNFRKLKETHFPGKTDWRSQSDTEVLLHLFIKLKEKSLELLNGFFALAIYDKEKDELFIARDRFGKKPLHYFKNEKYFVFASEIKALLEYEIPRVLNHTALFQYLQLNYIPQPNSIFEGVKKLKPGHYMFLSKKRFEIFPYYELKWKRENNTGLNYSQACDQLEILMNESVKERLIADVPLGAFLSGGIDSSVVVAMASKHTSHLNTFTIGYRDNPFFNESQYAELVATKYKTNHTVFSLTNDDFLSVIDDVLNYIDEPFADSSAIPVYILSMHTRKHVTVALSGDGGDEVFAGYNKHKAEMRMRQNSLLNNLVKAGAPLWKILPQSRNNKTLNLFRQLDRFAAGARLDVKERYWQWAGFLKEESALKMLTPQIREKINLTEYKNQKNILLNKLEGNKDLEDFLATDMGLVLLSDMLVKVDMMSMANSLEIRSPFLSHEVVDFAFSLPTEFKINGKMKKRIVQDTFRRYLPLELYNRPKKGFEIPLLDWFNKELRSRITDDLLNDKFIEEQGIFQKEEIIKLKAKLFSGNPGDAHATIWALMVFQSWWRKWYHN